MKSPTPEREEDNNTITEIQQDLNGIFSRRIRSYTSS